MAVFIFKCLTIVIYIQSLRHSNGQYTQIWYDDMQQNNGWTSSGDVQFAYNSTSCTSGNCIKLTYDDDAAGVAWIRKETDVSQYSSLQLQYDVIHRSMETGDQCRVYYSYTDSSLGSRILIDSVTSPDNNQDTRTYVLDQEVILPDASSASTLWLWMEAWSPGGSGRRDFCYWDDAYLNGIQTPTYQPTPSPTEQPTPSPTNQPTPSPTEQPTPSPTINPTINPSINPTLNPTKNPTIAPTDNPTTPSAAPTKKLASGAVETSEVTTVYVVTVKVCDGCDFNEDDITTKVDETFSDFDVSIDNIHTVDDTITMDVSIKTERDNILNEETIENDIETELEAVYPEADVDVIRRGSIDTETEKAEQTDFLLGLLSQYTITRFMFIIAICLGLCVCCILGLCVYARHLQHKEIQRTTAPSDVQMSGEMQRESNLDEQAVIAAAVIQPQIDHNVLNAMNEPMINENEFIGADANAPGLMRMNAPTKTGLSQSPLNNVFSNEVAVAGGEQAGPMSNEEIYDEDEDEDLYVPGNDIYRFDTTDGHTNDDDVTPGQQ